MDKVYTNSIKRIFGLFFQMLIALALSWICLPYFRIEQNPIFLFPFAGFFYLCHDFVLKNVRIGLYKARAIYFIFSLLLSFTLVLSKHINLEYIGSAGEKEHLAFSSLQYFDLLALLILFYYITITLVAIVHFYNRKFSIANGNIPKSKCETKYGVPSKYFRRIILLSLLFLVAWLPYFLIYYPGLIFGDSLSSISEAMGLTSYTNHHPFFYTLFIKVCIQVGLLLGDMTLGCAIYTLLQMFYISLILSYCVFWLYNKIAAPRICLFIVLIYSFMGCFPQHAISMWKDPIFSVSLLIYGLKLFDLILSNGCLAKNGLFLIQIGAIMLVVCLTRNNGIYIIAFTALCLFVYLISKKSLNVSAKVVAVHGVLIITVLFLTGPVYDYIGIWKDDVESFGIPLQQVARTIVYNGTINSTDLEFLNALMPLNKWSEVYTPNLVDPIKWDSSFDGGFFKSHKTEFLMVWMRTFLKNPIIYLEAWCCSTYGYWMPNIWSTNQYTGNITSGNLDSLNTWWAQFPIFPQNLLHSNALEKFFSLETPLPSIGLILWFILFVCLLAFIHKESCVIFLYLPCLANTLTLLIAAPSAYWPRYSLVSYYILPFVLAFPLILRKLKNSQHKNA